MIVSLVVLQSGLPDVLPGLVAIGGTIVLLLMLVALGGYFYKSLTGGIEWPDDREPDDDALQRGDEDDEWDYY